MRSVLGEFGGKYLADSQLQPWRPYPEQLEQLLQSKQTADGPGIHDVFSQAAIQGDPIGGLFFRTMLYPSGMVGGVYRRFWSVVSSSSSPKTAQNGVRWLLTP